MSGEIGRDPVHNCLGRKDYIRSHRCRRALLETVEVMRAAHPVLASQAVAALPAGDDLLRHHAVTNADPPPFVGLLVEADHSPRELMTWYYLSLRVSRTVLVAPELHGPVITLEVTGADANRLDPH